MAEERLPSRADNFSEWYNQLVLRAELADYAPVRGCMVVRPYGWALWENIQAALDRRFKATGHLNAAFPLLIPMSFLEQREGARRGLLPGAGRGHHRRRREVRGAAGRPADLRDHHRPHVRQVDQVLPRPAGADQPVEQRRALGDCAPSSSCARLEFYWQEGHTAHATPEEAEAETRQMLDVYADFAVNEAAIPVDAAGARVESEKFAGADASYSIEAMMGDSKALQAGHLAQPGPELRQGFRHPLPRPQEHLQFCWTTSWGFSTRFIGAIIMVHGDDQGLILPPRLAPYQVVIVPIYKNDAERVEVLQAVDRLRPSSPACVCMSTVATA